MLNVGILTGKTEELTRALRKSAHWYLIHYFGSPHTHYGVDIAISEDFRDAIKEVERFNDWLMKLTIISADRTIHFFTTYAPQTGRPDAEKDAFRHLLDEKTRHVPADEHIIIAGDLIGHVGEKAGGNRCNRFCGHPCPCTY